jgi:hypothetical protein
MACKIVRDKELRKTLGDMKCLHVILKRLCAAPKSRDLCDVIVWCFLPRRLDVQMKEIKHASPAEIVGQAVDPDRSLEQRLAAMFRLHGGKFQHVSKHGNPPCGAHFGEALEKMGLPPLFRFIAGEGYKSSGEALGIPIPFVWQMMCCSADASAGEDPFENGDNAMLNGVYAATFDKHTWKGKAAIKKFMGWHPIKEWLDAHPKVDRLMAIERAVFYVEGALLRPRLTFDLAHKIFWDVLDAKMLSNRFSSSEEGVEFYKLVSDNLNALNICRQP